MHIQWSLFFLLTCQRVFADIGRKKTQSFIDPSFQKYFLEITKALPSTNAIQEVKNRKAMYSLPTKSLNEGSAPDSLKSQNDTVVSLKQNNILRKGQFQRGKRDIITTSLGFQTPSQVERQTNTNQPGAQPTPSSTGTQFLAKLKFLESKFGGLNQIRQSPEAMNYLFDTTPLSGVQTSPSKSVISPNTPTYFSGQSKSTLQPKTTSNYGRQAHDTSMSNMLSTLMLAGGGEGLMENPLLLSQLMNPNQDQGQILQTLALTGSIEGVNPLLLNHLARNSQKQGQSSSILPLLALSGGGENPLLLLHMLNSYSNQGLGTGVQSRPSPLAPKISPAQSQQTSGFNDISLLLALSGGGENMNPLLLRNLMTGSRQGQGHSNIMKLVALTGGVESPLMENPALMYHLTRMNRQSSQTTGLGSGYGASASSKLLPLLLAGGEGLSGNPLLMQRLLRGGGNRWSSLRTF